MPKIHVLDKAVAELIAAGEVVERPASIVKELVENAVDAGANAVTVEIQDGGVTYIRVTDNGCGIDKDDIPRAFIRHATSKVLNASDLAGIRTLGFRGEALASIAAMCRVALTTKTADATEGVCCQMENGEVAQTEPAGCPQGTTIEVRDVFYNTPARMKFLKKDVSEGNAVAQVVDKCALSHPEIAFHFIRDGATKLRTSGNGNLLSVIRAIYGKTMSDSMIPVDYTHDDTVRVHGYVSSPSGAKPSRTYQNFFINGRYVRTRTAAAALEEAFKNKLVGKRHPACVLNLELDAETVDVNVHPAKLEVRFSEEKPIFHAVYFGVKNALQTLESPLAAPKPKTEEPQTQAPPPPLPNPEPQRMTAQEFRALFADDSEEGQSAFNKPVSLHSSRLDIAVGDDPTVLTRRPPRSKAYSSAPAAPPPPTTVPPVDPPLGKAETGEDTAEKEPEPLAKTVDGRLIGELFSTYILLEQGKDLVLVDKHAAHERILYEKLRENLQYGNRQILLTPQPVTLAREEYDALLSDVERVEAMGFLVEDFGDSTVLVRETPIELGQEDVAMVVSEMADRIRAGNQDLTPDALDRLYYNIACRSALKGGDQSHPFELEDLVQRLQDHPEITHCPHGRPVVHRIRRREVEKWFGRLG